MPLFAKELHTGVYVLDTTVNLFFTRKFEAHRLLGLAYLLQYVASLHYYATAYHWYIASPLMWSLPLTGLLQAVNASVYFKFLPKNKADPGYYSNHGSLTYNFIVENIFFAGLLLFQWIYMTPALKPWMPRALELVGVFFPYVIRPLFPQTSFRDSLKAKSADSEKQRPNWWFFYVTARITKVFYIWAKHYIGFFLNYARFCGRLSEEDLYHIHLLLIFSAAATTIGMFLHTLAFKHYMSKRNSYVVYMLMYLSTFYCWVRVRHVFPANLDLCLLAFGGVVVNFKSRNWQYAYQVFAAVLLTKFFKDGRFAGVDSIVW